jgi:predicted O-methyltransferase YrrM
VIGAASEARTTLIREQVEPFDLFFIDAEKPSNPE